MASESFFETGFIRFFSDVGEKPTAQHLQCSPKFSATYLYCAQLRLDPIQHLTARFRIGEHSEGVSF